MRSKRRVEALACALALTLSLGACAGSGTTAGPADGGGTAASTQAEGLVGKPWVTSVLQGNLPAKRPEAKDDLYTSVAYDYLSENQELPGSVLEDASGELQSYDLDAIKGSSSSGHDMEQLRIFFDQAKDLDTLKKTGLSELQPYLDRIDAVSSIDELSELIAAKDFPFSPFVYAIVKTNDTTATNIVGVMPNFLFSNALLYGGKYYQDSDDPQVQEAATSIFEAPMTDTISDFVKTGMSLEDAQAAGQELLTFEMQHGKCAESPDAYLKKDYGELAKLAQESVFTLDELCKLCPSFPMKRTLQKLGKQGSASYTADRAWVEAIGALWTDENLDLLKLTAKAKLLQETRPYRDPSPATDADGEDESGVDGEEFAYKACDSSDTFAQVLAKTYADGALGDAAKRRLTDLTESLVAVYRELFEKTPWVGDESRKRMLEKLDHMTLNVLEPTGGYSDYAGLELVPTEKGGTLFANYLRLKQYRLDRESEMIGQPARAVTAWFALEPTVMNAFYDPDSNSINIFPGFVSSAVYRDDMSEEELLAGIGFVIGHEISHGFDYMGSQSDAYGRPELVFSDADVDRFVTKCSALALYYKGIELRPGLFVDGQNVVGEAAADLSGAQAIIELGKRADRFDFAKLFESMSHTWAETIPEEYFAAYATDSHPLSNLRVNVNAQMFDEFYDAYGAKEGDGMYLAPNERIHLWGEGA